MKFDKKSATAIIIASILIQFLIISYNNYTGYVHIKSIPEFAVRLIFGSLFSSLIGFLLFITDVQFINFFNKNFNWQQAAFRRILGEFILASITGLVVGGIITIVLNLFFPYKDNLPAVIINNGLITSVVNIIFVIVIEAVIFFNESRDSQIRAEKLEKENAEIRLETLKSQLNPHFLFNSLNVLSALIKKDSEKAQFFVEEFSVIYRYILDSINHQLVPLKEELEFSKSFFYLQKVRFGNSLNLEIDINADLLDYMIPPLAIQTLIENAIKHNIISDNNSLNIIISGSSDRVTVKNNLRLKPHNEHSKGIGLENLRKRYEIITEKLPEFKITENEYIGILPLITEE